MSERWFLSSVATGAAATATELVNGRPSFTPSVTINQHLTGQKEPLPHPFTGPRLSLLGPGDVLGFDPALVTRVEPPAGCPNGVASNLAVVEFADASLPWLFSVPKPGNQTHAEDQRRPWLVLIVLRDNEGEIAPGNPLPVINVPAAALPDLRQSWAWAHIEARVDDGEQPQAAVAQDIRTGLDTVISRLICPRKLEANIDWLACVVPATAGGRDAGLNSGGLGPNAGDDAWSPGQGALLPVYYSWKFRTGKDGSFEDLARKVRPFGDRPDDQTLSTGFGSRKVDVSNPWLSNAPEPVGVHSEAVTVNIQGALRLTNTQTDDESWSNGDAKTAFRQELKRRLDAPGKRRTGPDHLDRADAPGERRTGSDLDRDESAVAPPLYGSHHTGIQTVPNDGWMNALNQQVQFRIAAALGARYVQLEQEFLMARAWEQVGAINDANRLLAGKELAAQAAALAQDKHFDPLDDSALTRLVEPLRTDDQVVVNSSLASVLAQSAAPDGLASTTFTRLTRQRGALARRAARAAGEMASEMPTTSVLSDLFDRTEVAPPTVSLSGSGPDELATTVVNDPSSRFAAETMKELLLGQHALFNSRTKFGGETAATEMNTLATTMTGDSAGAAALTRAPAPSALRGLRRTIIDEKNDPTTALPAAGTMRLDELTDAVRTSLQPIPNLLKSLKHEITRQTDQTDDPALHPTGPKGPPSDSEAITSGRNPDDPRPLRPLMKHPQFLFPIGAELLHRWPEWAIPGISGFPENRTVLLETNSAFVEALLVGLNQEFNRELRWREYPTDEAGTPFARFWPGRDPSQSDYGEIALWAAEDKLGDHDTSHGKDRLVLLIRAEVLQRYPGTTVLAAKAKQQDKTVPDPPDLNRPDLNHTWMEPSFLMAVDERTNLYGFDGTLDQARAENWLFVMQEPMRGTQFGFDVKTDSSPQFDEWADLTWNDVPQERGFVLPEPRFDTQEQRVKPPTPSENPQPPRPLPLPDAHFAKWGNDSADMARIAFRRPFQLAFSPRKLINERPTHPQGEPHA